MKKTNFKNQFDKTIKEIGGGSKARGITLISLVVTIIILLILAGITISTLKNSNLFENAKKAGEKYEIAKQDEENILNYYNNQINSIISYRDNASATLVWSNESPTTSFSAQTINIDLREYSAVLIKTKYRNDMINSVALDQTHQIILMGRTGTIYGHGTRDIDDDVRRNVVVKSNGIEFLDATYRDGTLGTDNSYCIPTSIYGIKNYDINI